MKEWLIRGILIGTINIPINYLTRQFYIISSNDYYYLNYITKSCIASCVFLFTYDIVTYTHIFAACVGIISGIQKYLYINTRDVSCIDTQYVERITTMILDSCIWNSWNSWNAMSFGGGTIITLGVILFDNATISSWFNTQYVQVLPLYQNLLNDENGRHNERNHQYVGSILLKSVEYIALKSIIYYENNISLSNVTTIIYFYTIGRTFVFTIIKFSMDGNFILDKYTPVENIRNKVFCLMCICILELCYDYGLIFILTYKPNIGYALIILDTYRLVQESVIAFNIESNNLTHELTTIGIIVYIYGALFFYPTFIFLN
tara:strand:+ start:4299 stop:5252 length:954 start_codon:yes stop_codon:yes gene_type:complete